jgi:excisionase family DNA binding protein
VSVYEAAEILGITVDAIRKRIQRGTIPHERGADGRVWVMLDTLAEVPDNDQDTYSPQPDTTALISRLEDEVRFLREELARKDAILLRMAESIPQLEAPSEPRESPVTDAEGKDRGSSPTNRRRNSQVVVA